MSKKRITVTLDEELDKKIRNLQVQLILSTQKGWSYSRVLTDIVEKGFEAGVIKKMSTKSRR